MMTIVYAIASTLFAMLVLFWLVRAIVVVAIKKPESRATVWLQTSFFSLGLASRNSMVATVVIYVVLAATGYLIGFPIAATCILGYLCLLLIQWSFVCQPDNRARLDTILSDEEIYGERA